MFAPAPKDFNGYRLFTGEKLTSRASIAHILGEESLRALYMLKVKDREIMTAIENAKSGLQQAIKRSY